jgi:hypothetical protein
LEGAELCTVDMHSECCSGHIGSFRIEINGPAEVKIGRRLVAYLVSTCSAAFLPSRYMYPT